MVHLHPCRCLLSKAAMPRARRLSSWCDEICAANFQPRGSLRRAGNGTRSSKGENLCARKSQTTQMKGWEGAPSVGGTEKTFKM